MALLYRLHLSAGRVGSVAGPWRSHIYSVVLICRAVDLRKLLKFYILTSWINEVDCQENNSDCRWKKKQMALTLLNIAINDSELKYAADYIRVDGIARCHSLLTRRGKCPKY
jgi:hypothetical protein